MPRQVEHLPAVDRVALADQLRIGRRVHGCAQETASWPIRATSASGSPCRLMY